MAAAKKPSKKNNKKKPGTFSLSYGFPTILISRDWEDVDDLNDRIREAIWRERALNPEGLYRSNQAGTWHSNDKLFDTLGDDGKTLKDMFGQAFIRWGEQHGLDTSGEVNIRMAAWAMVYSDRGYAAAHTHPNCDVSGVYYVDDQTADRELIMATGVPVRAGDIEFIDTRTGGQRQSDLLRLNPTMIVPFKRGRMLVFPSSLPHYVHPVVGPGERISISCNCTFLSTKEKPK
jgi:uncharacterized protein (TIGR02466 family)